MDLTQLIEEAIEDEKRAAEKYRLGAELAEDPETRSFFEQLVSWEQGHERILRDRLAALKLLKNE